MKDLRRLLNEIFDVRQNNSDVANEMVRALKGKGINVSDVDVTSRQGFKIIIDNIDDSGRDQVRNITQPIADASEYVLLADHEIALPGADEYTAWMWWFTPDDVSSKKEKYTLGDFSVLYHSTSRSSLRSILDHGLIPRTRMDVAGGQTSRRYRSRIYLATDKNTATNYVHQMEDNVDGYDGITFMINPRDLSPDIPVYADEEYPVGNDGKPTSVYVTDNIPQRALVAVDNYTYKRLFPGPPTAASISEKSVLKHTKKLPKAPHTYIVKLGLLIAVDSSGHEGGYWNGKKWRKIDV
jgi:hypothetical protein